MSDLGSTLTHCLDKGPRRAAWSRCSISERLRFVVFLDGQLASTAMLFYGMEFCGRLLCPHGGTGSGMGKTAPEQILKS